jgi:hypothetical protein
MRRDIFKRRSARLSWPALLVVGVIVAASAKLSHVPKLG